MTSKEVTHNERETKRKIIDKSKDWKKWNKERSLKFPGILRPWIPKGDMNTLINPRVYNNKWLILLIIPLIHKNVS